jgi:ankyrin repeat protein
VQVIEMLIKRRMTISTEIWDHVHTMTTAQLLVDNGFDVTSSLVHLNTKDINVYRYLIDKGANVNETDDKNNTPLHYVSSGNVAELLINNGTPCI